jgi:hypothetical protein
MNRHQRRAYEKVNKIGSAQNDINSANAMSSNLKALIEDFRNIQSQLVKMVEFNKSLFKSVQIVRETLERKGFLTIDDIKDTENLYRVNIENRDKKIKEVLSSDMTDDEKIEMCLQDAETYKPGYEKLNLNPVRDLNVAPNVVNDYLIHSKEMTGLNYKQYALFLGVPEVMLVKPLPEPKNNKVGKDEIQGA